MDESEQKITSRPSSNSNGSFQCFGFGFNGFAQVIAHKSKRKDDDVEALQEVPRSSAVQLTPVALNVDCVSSIVASWSNTFYLKGRLCYELSFNV